MKKLILIFTSLFLFALQGWSQAESAAENSTVSSENINPKTGFPMIKEKPFVAFDEGLSFATVTRLEKQSGRSNYVWNDHLIGAYFAMQTDNMRPCNSIIKISAYYPYKHYFNNMEQFAKQTVLYAFDLFAGPIIEADMWKYVGLKFGAGLHYMYQLSDEYHYHYVGLGILTGIELPVAHRWTILLNGSFNLDYPNLGTNGGIQPLDLSWQYHFDLGVRYSRKMTNKYSYVRQIKKLF